MQSLCNDEPQKAVSGLDIGGAVRFYFIECRHLVYIELTSHLDLETAVAISALAFT